MGWGRLRNIPPEVSYTLLLFVVTRIVLTVIGLVSRAMLPQPFAFSDYVPFTGNVWLDMWGVWDAWWYDGLADVGYVEVYPPRSYGNYAFFPLYPMVMRAFGALLGSNYAAGLLVSNVSLILAGIFLYRLARKDWDHATGMQAVTALFLFPTAFVFSGVQNEGLFLLVAVLAFLYARESNWLLAGLFGMLTAMTKQVGVLIVVPLAIEYYRQNGWSLKRAAPLLLVPLGLGIVMFAQYLTVGDPLGFAHVQPSYGRPMSPLYFFTDFSFTTGNIISLLFGIAGLGVLCAFHRNIRTSYFVFGVYSLLVPIFSGIALSLPRFVLQVFPLFFLIAHGLRTKYGNVLAIALALLQGFLMVFWTTQSTLVV